MDFQHFTISVCIISKNEAKTIARVLSQAQKFAEEIIVVDTGSIDNTKEIAKSFTEKVFDFEWCDDFSEARNFAFNKATCDFLMWLDCDDFLPDSEIEKIQKLKLSEPEYDVYMLKYGLDIDEFGNSHFEFYRERLLRRSKNFRWTGRVHECITPSGKIGYFDITIQHRKIKQNSPKRNLKIYQKMKREKVQFSPRELFYYSRELYFNGYISSAIKNLQKFIKIPNTYSPDNLGAYMLLSDCFLLKNLQKHAKTALFDCLKRHNPTSELCCKIAKIVENEGSFDAAIFWYKSALNCTNNNGFVFLDYGKIVPYIELSRLYYKIDYQSAKNYHILAKQIAPNHPSVLFNEKFFDKP
jgi:glycosyltransferase involved in cell wall biosynthesis